MLDDSNIRQALKGFLFSKSKKQKVLVDELRIHNGNSIADVVAIYNTMHGYEIKGETDTVARLKFQVNFYNISFPNVTLVTTKNHLEWAKKNLPSFWGILLATKTDSKVHFRYHRKSGHNPLFCQQKSLAMLWKSELIELSERTKCKHIRASHSRSLIAEKLQSSLKKSDAALFTSKAIANRYLEVSN
jgi:hypothetical protein